MKKRSPKDLDNRQADPAWVKSSVDRGLTAGERPTAPFEETVDADTKASPPVGRKARAVTNWFFQTSLVAVTFFGCFGLSFYWSTQAIVKGVGTSVLQDLRGATVLDAAVSLAEKGWEVSLDHFEDSEKVDPHSVIVSNPQPGTELRRGSVVSLVVSRGARRIPVPNVNGVHLKQAQLILQRNGLSVTDVIEVYSSEYSSSVVFASSPQPSALVAMGEAIKLLVSKGPNIKRWLMPDLVGVSREFGEKSLEQMNIRLRRREGLYDPGQRRGVVLEQYPLAGEEVREGEVVTLTSNGDPLHAFEKQGARLVPLRILVPAGLKSQEVEVRDPHNPWEY